MNCKIPSMCLILLHYFLLINVPDELTVSFTLSKRSNIFTTLLLFISIPGMTLWHLTLWCSSKKIMFNHLFIWNSTKLGKGFGTCLVNTQIIMDMIQTG